MRLFEIHQSPAAELIRDFHTTLQSSDWHDVRENALVDLNIINPDEVEIELIEVFKERRRQGLGKRIMSELIQLADQYGVQLRLEPNSLFGEQPDEPDLYADVLPQDDLIRWYERFGFVPEGKEMIRPPAARPLRRTA